MTEERVESIAFCWSKKAVLFTDKAWYCHGPVQKVAAYPETFARVASLVGCENASWGSKRYSFTHGGKRGFSIYCNRYLRPYDHDIAKMYSVPGSLVSRRKTYICPKYTGDTKRCKVK